MSPKRRLYIRVCCFALAIFLLLPLPFWSSTARVLVQASAFVAIGTILAGGAFRVASILGLLFAAISLMRPRWFCRFACPVGVLLDAASAMHLPKKFRCAGCPPIGHYLVLLTLAGALVGYPLFLWLDPLAFFNSAFSAFSSSHALAGILSFSGMAIVLALALTSNNLWCARLCPLGATQDLLQSAGSFCRSLRKSSPPEASSTPIPVDAVPGTRRRFLAIAAGVGFSLWAIKTGRAGAAHAPLRPPGAAQERAFTGLCLRCGNCMRACPSKIIHPDTGLSGVLGFLAPVVRYDTDYCLQECHACTHVCPSGALHPLTLEQKHQYVIGTAQLDQALCLYGISDCSACVHACAFDAIKIAWDKQANASCPVVDPRRCNGCGACEAACPTGEVKAIKVLKRSQ